MLKEYDASPSLNRTTGWFLTVLLFATLVTISGFAAGADKPRQLDPATLKSLKRSDFITQEDIDRSQGGYKLTIPGGKEIFIKGIRGKTDGKRCLVHIPSVIKILADDPPELSGPKWLQITIYDCPWGTCCLGPLDGGCYIIVSRT